MVVTVILVKTVNLFFLVFSLYQCISGQPDQLQPGFTSIQDAVETQQKYLDQWNRLKMKGEIVETTHRVNQKNFPMFKFEGENIRQMKVKEIFIMLQNWLRVIPDDRSHRFVEMNLGGENYKFRLHQGKSGQILVSTEAGDLTEYEDIATILDEGNTGVHEIAEHMLTSSNEPMNAQTHWPDNINAQSREKMRALMVISQVAEAARPSDESFTAMKGVMNEVLSFETLKESKIWQRDMKKKIRKLRKAYKNIDERSFTSVLESHILRKAARDIVNGAPDHTFLNNLPENFPLGLKRELLNTGKSVIKTVNKSARRKFNGKIRGLKPKNGRIPGADNTIRSVLDKLAKSEAPTFRDAFEKDFILSKKGGTQLARMDIFQDVGSNVERSLQRPNVDIIAARDGAVSNIEERIAKVLRPQCAPGRRRKRQSLCSHRRKMLVEESFRWTGDTLHFETVDEEGSRQSHEVMIDLDELSLTERTEEYIENLERNALHEEANKASTSRLQSTAETALGVHGAVINIFGSIHYFSQDDFGNGAFSAAQAAHGIGGLTGVNDVVSKTTKKALDRAFVATADKVGLKATVERVSEVGSKALGRTASKTLSRFASSVPIVGLAFDAKFIADDVEELKDSNSSLPKSLRVAHLILDIDTTVLTLIESIVPASAPVVGPLIIASTIIRLGIDDFYLDIQEELSKVEGKNFGTKVGAVLKGSGEGLWDALTLGFGRQRRQLDQQLNHDRQLLHNLSNPVSYFNVTFQGRDSNGKEVGTVDFTAGILSQHGGFLTLTMNEDGSFTVEFPEVPIEGGGTMPIKQTFSFDHPVNDVVLGVGQVSHPNYIQQETKLWLLFTVDTADTISGFENHQSSQYGTYYGNSHDNNFYALQASNQRKRRSADEELVTHAQKQYKRQSDSSCNNHSLNSFTIQLQSYHYDLYGRGGNDNFFLGPQSSRVAGGDDNDFYHIPSTGGKAIIDNFAHDEEMDTLLLDISFSDVYCARDKWDLIIGYCQSHAVQIENWFSHGAEEFHRHLHISTADGVVIDVTKSDLNIDNHHTVCAAVSVDKSRSSAGETVTLTGSFSEVEFVLGSNYSDIIIGNDKRNTLNGGLGNDHIQGGNGADIYIIEEGSGSKIINNFAIDNTEDLLHIGISYVDIAVEISRLDLILYCSSSNDTRIQLTSWLRGQQWQHMTFISHDYVMFTVNEDDMGRARKHPLTINLGDHQNGVILDLMDPENSENVTVNSEIADEVKTVLDTPYDDRIIGNSLGNFFLCSGGSDFLQGNGGKDTYKIDKMCHSATIQNFDQARHYDLILLECPSTNINLLQSSEDLIIGCSLSQSRTLRVYLKQWFNSTQYQHLRIKTSDKITAFLPESTMELQANQGHLFPVQIEKDEDCEGEHREIDLSNLQFSKCERLVAKTDACSYSITGNNLNNYIDPGPGNPFGYQRLKGANGTDTYVMGHRYGTFNVIDNYAEDGQVDHLLFEVIFHDIEVSRSGMDIFVTSLSINDSVRVRIWNYFIGERYQHLLVQSADNVLFKFAEEFPYTEVLSIDFSTAIFSQVINADDNSTYEGARVIMGSKVAENHIHGGSNTTKIIGGSMNDTIIGGPGGEDLFGADGDDIIYGGSGNDVLYGGGGDDFLHGGAGDDVIYAGMGADIINGSSGNNTVIFSGYNFTGVIVNLQIGLGWDADAEGDSYALISNIGGSEFDDTLIGNDNDNTIRGHGGDDFIYPAGGDDILRGGRGADVYYLNNAFGHKLIDNFATDNDIDLIVANNSLWEDTCYHFLGNDLQINFNFSGSNYSEAFARLTLNEVFLMVTFPFWLENATYQHVGFSFLDGYKSFEHYQNTTRQIQPAVDIINNETLFRVAGVYETEIDLTFYYDDLLDTAITTSNSDHVSLHLAHYQLDSAIYYPLSLSPSTITRNIRLHNVTAGTRHSFSLILSSCGLTVAISPLVLATTVPSLPTDAIVETFSEGFHLEWTEPDNETNPFVDDYVYMITIGSETESFVHNTTETEFATLNLIPETMYYVSICSKIYNVTSTCFSLSVSTAENACSNLQSLPSHYRVGEFQRNQQGQIINFVSCERGHQLMGDHRVVCNDTESSLPQCTIITCQVPSLPHAEKIMGPDTPRHTDSVQWRCLKDYWVTASVNNFTSVCLEGEWVPPIQTCTEKPTCSLLIPPQDGKTNSTARHVDDVVSYSCNTGYILHGPHEKTCMLNEHSVTIWLPMNETTCSALECILPSITNARILSETSNPSHGDTVQWGCDSGYWVRHGREEFNSTCFAGSWSPPLESCSEKPTCPSLTSPEHGSINSTSFYVDDAVSYNCDLGYARHGPQVKTCQFNENTDAAFWSSANEVTCHALECLLPSVSYATILTETSDPSHGDLVEWRCQDDYWVSRGVTEFSSTCSAGSWDPPVQSCIEKPRCLSPSIPQNGSINSTATIFHVDDAISYTCNVGYSFQGTSEKQCTLNENDGTTFWSPSGVVNCNVIECILPVVSHARVLSGNRASNPIHGDTVFWGCQNTYWVSHGVTDFSSTCVAGSWSPTVQSCTRKPTCSTIMAPQHGSINSTASNFYVDDAITFSCDFGYNLEGTAEKQCLFDESTNTANWSPMDQVTCNAIECSLPSISHADKLTGSSNPSHGDIVEWGCQGNYWVSRSVTEFNSTCSAGSWDPPVQNCVEKPTCSAPPIPSHGSINTTASVFHVDDVISYSCNSGYSHQGVGGKTCLLSFNGITTYWSPYGYAYCNAMQCPDLLPQPNGRYSPVRQHYYTGNTVELVCNQGYYIRNNQYQPETEHLRCLGTDWNRTQTHCQVILQVSVSTLYINRAEGTARYAISSLENTPVPSSLYSFACNQMIGQHSSYLYVSRATRYRIGYQPYFYWEGWRLRYTTRTRLVPYSVTTVRCYTLLSITDGPNVYDGVLTIHTQNGAEKVCVEQSSAATSACNYLGYQQYTASHYQVGSGHGVQTTLSVSSAVVTNNTQSCLNRINCRQTCRALVLASGSGCLSGFEGQTCTVSCNAGYALIGSSSLTCNSNGAWNPDTGYHPRCDGEKWKADIERESRSQSSRSHTSLANYLRDYLHQHYPRVYWVVVVYDDVTGFPKHTVKGSYYHLFRHHGHNIVASRIIPGSSVHAPNNLGSALSQSYRKRQDCTYTTTCTYVLWFCVPELREECSLNAERTNCDTWDELQRRVSPVMLHVVRSGISVRSAWWADARYVISRSMNGGFVTLLAQR